MTKTNSSTNSPLNNSIAIGSNGFSDIINFNSRSVNEVKIADSLLAKDKSKPTIFDKINAVDHIKLDWKENTPTHGSFYTGFAINTLEAGIGGIAGIAKNFPKIKETPAAKKIIVAIDNFVKKNPLVKDFFRLEYDQGLTKGSGVLHLKFVVKCLQLIPKERRDKALSELNEILKKHSGPHTLGSTKAISALIDLLESKKMKDTITRKMEFRISLNPDILIGNEKGLEARASIHFSENIPLKKTFNVPGLRKLFKGDMSVVFFVSPRFYPNGAIKIIHGAEFNFPTKLGFNNFIPLGFSNSVEGTFLFKQNEHLGIEVTDGKWKGFMRLPDDIANGLKAFNLLGTVGVKESKVKSITLEEYIQHKFNRNLPPEIVKQATDFKQNSEKLAPYAKVLTKVGAGVNTGLNTKMVVKATEVAAKPVGQTIAKIAVKIAPKLVVRAAPLVARAAPWLAGASTAWNPICWAISGIMIIDGIIQFNQEEYKDKIKTLFDNKLYNPDYGIPAMIKYMSSEKNYFIGKQARILSAVIDKAIIEGKVDPIKLRVQWNKKLDYVGKTSAETQATRLLAAVVLGRIDVVDKNIDRNLHTPTSLSSLEATQHHNQMVSSLGSDLSSSKSEKLLQATPKIKVYNSFSINMLDGHLSATPSQLDGNGNSKWLVKFKSQDGLISTFYKTFDRQINASDFIKGSILYKTIANSVNTQRAQFTKTPSYIKSWQGTLYGNPVTAIPLYMKKDGSIIWKVTATSNGKVVTIYESLGLTNQTGYQFDSSDLQDGHIFKMRLDDIMSGRTKQ